MIFVIDPGHGMDNRNKGSYDPGAVWPGARGKIPNDQTEAGLALIYALALQAVLEEGGHTVHLTRPTWDTGRSLSARVALAKRSKADLLVSLHLNAAPDALKGKARGHECLYRRQPWSAAIARRISDALAPIIPPHGAGVVERKDLAVLAYTPSVLVELGFIDHDEDYALLMDASNRAAICAAIAKAIGMEPQISQISQKGPNV